MTLAADPQITLPASHHSDLAQAHRTAEMLLWLLPVLLLGLALAVKTWGMVALTLVALPLVPLMFFFFIAISLP